jgi:DNA-binding NtrC family response regulator
MQQTFPGMNADFHNGAVVGPIAEHRHSGNESEAIRHPEREAVPGREPRGDFSWMVGMSLAEIERHALLQTLAACNGNKARAARMLGVSEKTIYNKLKQYRRRS